MLIKYRIAFFALFLAAGIYLREVFRPGHIFVLTVIIAILVLVLSGKKICFLLFLPLGLIITPVHRPPPLFKRLEGKYLIIKGTVLGNPENRKTSTRLFIKARHVNFGNKTYRTDSLIVAYCKFPINDIPGGSRVLISNIRLKRIRNFNNPGVFNIVEYYSRKNIFFSGFINKRESIRAVGRDDNYNSMLYVIERERMEFTSFVRSRIMPPDSEIINALSVGVKASIPSNLKERFTALGISHIFAISGLHVGFVALVFYSFIKWLLKRSEYLLLRFQVRKISAFLTILPVFHFTALTGFSTSAVRAMIMVIVYLFAIIAGRKEFRINSLALAAILILMAKPYSIFELSFRLSFIAVLGILIVHNFYPYNTKTISDRIKTGMKVTTAATFCTLPFTVNAFGYFPISSIPANMLIIPFIEILVMPMAILSVVFFHVSEWLTVYLLKINSFVISFILGLTSIFEKTGIAYFIIPKPDTITIVLFFTLGLCLLLMKSYTKLIYLIPLLALLVFASLKCPEVFTRDNRLSISYFDSGYKDIYMLELPGGTNFLLNGGYSYYSHSDFIEDAVLIPYLLYRKITAIDYLVLTSLDTSHIRGAVKLLQKIQVKNIWTNGSKLDSDLWEVINKKHIHWKDISTDTESFGMEGVKFEFIKPRGHFKVTDYRQPLPIVIKLKYGNNAALLGESLDKISVQKELTDIYGELIRSNIIYIPGKHHGKISKKFIETSGAEYIVCKKCEDPTSGLKKKYKILESDHAGMINAKSDGYNIRFSQYLR